VFFGTPDFAVASLEALVNASFDVVGVVTAPDKPAGRGHKLQAPPVKVFAEQHGIKVLQPPRLKAEEFIDELRRLKADLQIVVAFRMLPEVVWNMPELGTYNVHASLLPDYRGAAPINWAIIRGEKKTGVTTFKLKHEIDTGNTLLQAAIAIEPNDTAGSLHDKLMALGAETLVKSVKLIAEGNTELKPQPEQAQEKHAPKIFKEDCRIHWNQTAQEVHDFVRGMAPFPGAFTDVDVSGVTQKWKIAGTALSGEKADGPGLIRIREHQLQISTQDEWLDIKTIQAPGKKRLNTDEFLRGARFEPDSLKIIA